MTEHQADHVPVLCDAVLRWLAPEPGHVVLDGTVGLGGHAAVILPHIQPGGRYIGIDLDPAMLDRARERLSGLDPSCKIELLQANYAEIPDVLKGLGLSAVDRILLDLGVNSVQLADAGRGFSFERDGPLDMRFDPSQQKRALDLVNGLAETELANIFWEYGQEGMSRKIARRICQVRHNARITTTLALARAVESAMTAAGEGGKLHPATRVFQALRVAVNRELENLKRFLELAPGLLRPGGRLVVISFHSLEDGLVKHALRATKAAGTLEELTRRPEVADPRERGRNPRSRSAKLRAAVRLPDEPAESPGC